MRLEYIGLSELSGSLIALEGVKDVAYDEMAEVTLENGERRYGRVILIDGDRVVLQVFEGTRGISLENASTHFTGKSMDIALSKEMLGRIFDGAEEVISAEYMPMVLQFGLSEEYDRLQISRLIPLLKYWPEENLAMQVTVESLIRPRFQRWLRDTLMQCEKSQRKRIIFELAEADVCQHISRLQPVIRLMNALGVRIAVTQAGLTLVSTSWIKELNVELLKLHPSLVRNIEKRTENQLLVQSLVEACTGTHTQVYATGVRSRSEWHTLTGRGVAGGQGDFFASSQPLDTNVKKYSQRYSV